MHISPRQARISLHIGFTVELAKPGAELATVASRLPDLLRSSTIEG